ncbi:YhdP family protein [Roseococcus pinisoli]|uniref:DUF3971 domain-containing protein n=1 Tax=Roseococcus pinisoli TaxID=2835040 RepID=A0ABS5QDX1_9PROT|nr:DUF3971 domain-containing protein [Roseococcus pinisoli]
MSQGQPPSPRRHLPRLAGWVCGLTLAIPLLGGLAIGALIARLAHSPLESTFLARQIENAANGADASLRIGIASAAVAWEGWSGRGAPLDIRLRDVTVRDATGQERARLPEAAVTLSIASLLEGTLAPSTIELRGAKLMLLRAADGSISLDRDGPPAPAEGQAPAAPATSVDHILADLMAPAEDRAMHTALRRIRLVDGTVTVRDLTLERDWSLNDMQIELQRLPQGGIEGDGEARMRMGEVELPVHLRGRAQGDPTRFSVRLDLPVLRPAELARVLPPLAPLAMLDAPVAIQARAEFDGEGRPLRGGLDIQATEGGHLRLDGATGLPFARLSASLEGNRQRISLELAQLELPGRGRTTLEVTGGAALGEAGWAGELRAGVAQLDLTEIPELWPEGLAPEFRTILLQAAPRGAVRDAALRLEIAADADLAQWRLPSVRVDALLADAVLVAPGGPRLAVGSAEVAAELRPGALRVEHLVLRWPTPPGEGAYPSTLRAEGQATLSEGRWRGTLDLGLDRARFADLRMLWPEGLVPGARHWITENVTAGEATAGNWQVTGEVAEDYSDPKVTGLTGRVDVSDATVHWLRPMPPVRNASGHALFGLDAIEVRVAGARQENAAGQPSALEIRTGSLRFLLPPGGQESTEMSFGLAGPVTEIVNVLKHPRLHLFDRRPFPVTIASGAFEGRLNIGFPLVADLHMEQVRIRAEARATNTRFTRLLFDRDLEEASLDLTTDGEQLRLQGTASMIGIPLRIGVEMDFRPGAGSQVVSRETVTARGDAERLAMIGFDTGNLLRGPVAFEVRTERRRNGQGVVNLQGDLRDAVLAFSPLGFTKAPGIPGNASAVFRLQGERLAAIDNIRISAPELALRGRATTRAGRIDRLEFQETSLGGSRFTGEAITPAATGQAWNINMRGPVLDLRAVLGPGSARGRGASEPEESQAPMVLDLRFDQVLLGPARELFAARIRARVDSASVPREVNLQGRTSREGGPFELAVTPHGEARQLRGTAEDGGGLLRAFGIVETIQGGRLTLNGQYERSTPGAPLAGTAELDNFTVRDAPVLGKVLQAMTLFGVVEAMQRGLVFSRAVVPFVLTPEALRIEGARAFSASLGLTARGQILRERSVLDIEGTIVPAYFFNTLLGNLPLVGRLFSPEQGGGVFAATFRARGPAETAEVSVNPLAALTPGFLRGLFGLTEGSRPPR